jgi:energy-coupling factor transport system substrate-specific component
LTRWLDTLILLVASFGGLAAFLYPFFSLAVVQSVSGYGSHATEAPLLTIGLVTLCLGAVLATLGGGGMNAKMVAVLGVLVAANAVLRAVPGPAGFAAVFMLPVLCGYLYGATFGFLLGSLSLLVSALIGAGVGPWLPYQMLAVGWVGLTSAWMRPALRVLRPERHPRGEVAALGAWGLLWGFSFGALMNIWFWPYVFQPGQADLYWQPGMGLAQTLRHYAAFYVVTSFWWDLGRAAGNALLIWAFGVPILRLLRRFQQRFSFSVGAAPAGYDASAPAPE